MRAVLGWWTATHKSNVRCYTCVQELIASWLVLDDLPLSDVDAFFSTRTNFVQVDPAVVNLLHSSRMLHSDCPPNTDSLRLRLILFVDPRPCHARIEAFWKAILQCFAVCPPTLNHVHSRFATLAADKTQVGLTAQDSRKAVMLLQDQKQG